MTKVDWTRKKTSDSALRSRDIDLVRFYFGNYELIAQRKMSGTVDAFFDLSLYNKGHYTGTYLLLSAGDFAKLLDLLQQVVKPAEGRSIIDLPSGFHIDKYHYIEVTRSKKLIGECFVIKKVYTDNKDKSTPRQIFFPYKVATNRKLWELSQKR